MARIRTIKPEFWTDAKIGECSPSARLLFVASWTFADDAGGLDRSAKQLKAQAFPFDAIDVEPLIQELLAQGLLLEYDVDGKKYLQIIGFAKHQKIDKPGKPRIPPPGSPTTRRTIVEDSPTVRTKEGADGKGRERSLREGSLRESKGEESARAGEGLAEVRPISEAVRACVLLRDAGFVQVGNAGHPALLATLAAGVSPETLQATAREFPDKGLAYWCSTAIGRARDQARAPAPLAARAAMPTLDELDELERRRGLTQ